MCGVKLPPAMNTTALSVGDEVHSESSASARGTQSGEWHDGFSTRLKVDEYTAISAGIGFALGVIITLSVLCLHRCLKKKCIRETQETQQTSQENELV